MSYEKYDGVPTQKQANYFLFSVLGIGKISDFVDKFPNDLKKQGCSATLAWSGVQHFVFKDSIRDDQRYQ